MKELWTNERKFGVLEKYQFALLFARQSLFEKGLQPYQRAHLVVGLRNDLVHPRPTSHTVGEEGKHENLKAEGFPPNPLVSPNNSFFPDQCLAHGCAKWALDSCEKFVFAFYKKMGLNPP